MKKITILLWLYHNDLAKEFYSLIEPLQDIVDCNISLCSDNDNQESITLFAKLHNVKSINYYDNFGADLYSFINEINHINTPYFIKLHSKKSMWGMNRRCNWRAMLVDSLIGDRQTLLSNINCMENNKYGAIGCGCSIFDNVESVHSKYIKELYQYFGWNADVKYKQFVGGNMFIGDTKLYQKYFSKKTIDILNKLIGTEHGKIDEHHDGTYCHALERILGYISANHGGLYPCPIETFKIKVCDPDLLKITDYIHLRLMYNSEIYCIEQPNMYGYLESIADDKSMFQILWKQKNAKILATYQKVSEDSYINQIHLKVNRPN